MQACLQSFLLCGDRFHCILMESGGVIFSLGLMQVKKKARLDGGAGSSQWSRRALSAPPLPPLTRQSYSYT